MAKPATCAVTPLEEPDAQAVLAEAHVRSADYVEQGIREFEEILRVHPDSIAANGGLGYAYLTREEYERALTHFQRAVELNSQDPGVYYYSAVLINETAFTREEHQRVAAQMKEQLRVAVALNPDFADAHALLGEAHSYLGEYDEAIASEKKAMALGPRNERYALSLAHYYTAAKRWDEAVALLLVLRDSSNSRVSANAVEQLYVVERSRTELQHPRQP